MSPVCRACPVPQALAQDGPFWPPHCDQQQWLCGNARESCPWQSQLSQADSKAVKGEKPGKINENDS